MNEAFDPYHKWLGIPPAEQPPNHYRLLGITTFESDRDVIDAAFYRQIAYVRTYQLGPYSDVSQTLLNELATARVCLLDSKKKATYDEELRARLGAGAGSGPSAVPPPGAPGPPTEPVVTAKPVVSARQEHAYRKNQPWPIYTAVGVGVLLLTVVLAFVLVEPKSDEVARTDQQGHSEIQTADAAVTASRTPPSQSVADTTTAARPLHVEPDLEENRISPGLDEPSPSEPLPTTPSPQDSRPEEPKVAGIGLKPDDSPRTQVPTMPPLPADAEDQLKTGLAKAQSPQAFRAIAEQALHYVDQAIVGNDPETAKKIATWAVAAAREAEIDDLSKTASLRYLELQGPLTEDVILGAKQRLENWKPMERLDQETHSAASVPDSAPLQRSLADLLNGDDPDH